MKKIIFLTGTRADFGKLKSLISITQNQKSFETNIFVTGMHLNEKYGYTVDEIYKSGFKNIIKYNNYKKSKRMDNTLASTITGFSKYISEINPDLIVIHGDRVEALAGSIVGSLNNILTAHIEGGEVSGTIDELIRHSVSKLSHVHLVSNEKAKKRLIQMGELESSIYVIGSPDLDLMNPNNLPSIEEVKKYYEISFDKYSILMFHPVTTEYDQIKYQVKNLMDALLKTKNKYVVIFPNNDSGSNIIIDEYDKVKDNPNFKIFPSLRFEYFLRLLEQSEFIIGNSSAGVREAPFYGTPSIDIGSRQHRRSSSSTITNTSYNRKEIIEAINSIDKKSKIKSRDNEFGNGKSAEMFLKLILSNSLWSIDCQKQFQDL